MKKIGFVILVLCLGLVLVGVALANTTKTIYAKALDDHECDNSEWHFVINQISEEGLAPTSIHVTWANGDEEDVGLSFFTPGGVAHYVTTANLGSTVTDAYTEIYEAWSGQFNLSHGPCPPPPPSPCNGGCEKDGDCKEGLACHAGACRNPDCPEETNCTCPPPPPAECDGSCEKSADCVDGLVCVGGVCRNPDCVEETNCICPPPPAGCNESCEEDTDCGGDLVCHSGVCRNLDCPEETDCLCPPLPPAKCDEACEEDTDCSGALVCYEGTCRNPTCPEETDCLCLPPPPPASCNLPPTEAGCKEGLGPYGEVCRNLACPEEPSCICPPPACYIRLNIWAGGCIPEGLAISCYFDFKENLYDSEGKPTGKKYIDKYWEGNPFWVDLDKGREFRCFAWTEQGGFTYLFNVGPFRECPKVVNEYPNFPCLPTPTPTPPQVEVLPVTGTGPPLATQATQSRVSPISLVGLALAAIGTYLRRRG